MSEIEARLEELGISLPEVPQPIANYVPSVRAGNLIFLSGLGPADRADGTSPLGKVGRDLTTEEGYEAARLTGINILARMKSEVGDLKQGPNGWSKLLGNGPTATRISSNSPP